MIHGVHHPALSVPDMDTALGFYCDVLGFEVVMNLDLPAGLMEKPFDLEQAACKVRMITKGDTCIELFEFENAPTGDPTRPVNQHGIAHIALASDDVPADYEHLKASGVRFNTPPQGESPQQWCYGRDPFGNVIELLEVPGE
jgi:catechol 2,3-dioxygenase-like lactoylglutathione lyase family enzyme